MDKLEVPVYLITGFLESGKTSFLQEIFESGEFADGERGLLISCEEGEVELDEKATLACKIDTVTLDEEEELTADFLENCKNVYKPKRFCGIQRHVGPGYNSQRGYAKRMGDLSDCDYDRCKYLCCLSE